MSASLYIILLFLPVLLGNGLRTYLKWDEGTRQELTKRKCIIQVNQPCYSMEYIKFYLYTSGMKKEELNLRDKYSPESYNSLTNLKVLIHGYSSLSFMTEVLQAYLMQGKASVLVVDWERLARKPCYVSAKRNTQQVGRCTGEAVALLRPRGELHIVGFSLGAHVAGLVSAYLGARHGIKIDRITGLDPALPLYATLLDNMKLDKTDANFVDVIHTDPGIYGKAEPSGHVDFYVNGATIQPGCFNTTNPPLCSHKRAAEVFAESINSRIGFYGVKCPSLFHYLSGYCRHMRSSSKRVLMGEYADSKSRGIYLVQTNSTSPYALG